MRKTTATRRLRTTRRCLCFAASIGFVTSSAVVSDEPQPVTDNPTLAELFAADQSDRADGPVDSQMLERDSERRQQVLQQLSSGRVRTAADHYHAAMVFQHRESADDFRTAFSLATVSMRLDPRADNPAKWLSAAAWDRLLMKLEQPQWYGTQYVDRGDGRFRLYDINETAVNDEDRDRLNVPTLTQARERVAEVNALFGSTEARSQQTAD